MRWVTYRLGRNDVAAFSLPPPSRRRDSSLGRADPIVPSIWGTWLLPRSVSIPGSNRGFREGEESGEALERLEGKGRIPACPSGSERVGGAGGGVARCETRGVEPAASPVGPAWRSRPACVFRATPDRVVGENAHLPSLAVERQNAPEMRSPGGLGGVRAS